MSNETNKVVTESLVSKRIQLSLHDGMTVNGSARLVTKSHNNINPSCSNEDMHEAAMALGSLYANELSGIYFSAKYLLQCVETEG